LSKEEVALAVVLHCMGNVHVKLGEPDEAKDCYERSLQVRRRHPVADIMSPDGEMKLHVSDTLHNLGCLYELRGDYVNALKYFATSLKLKHALQAAKKKDKIAEEENQKQIIIYQGKGSVDGSYLCETGNLSYALTLHRIGSVHHRMENPDIAVACFQSALKIQRQNLGTQHFTVARTLADMATTYRTMDQMQDRALDCYREACNIRRGRHGDSADVGHLLYRMGKMYHSGKDYTRAMDHYNQAIRVFGRRYVNAIGRHFCEVLLLRRLRADPDEDEDEDDGDENFLVARDVLGTEGLAEVMSIEDADRSSSFSAVVSALREASRHHDGFEEESISIDMDLSAPDCWISLELYLLSLAELVNFIAGQWREHAKLSIRHGLRQLEQVGVEGIRMDQDVITFQMLYLIQE